MLKDPSLVRWYDGYPSVTSVLQLVKTPEFIQAWIDKIGIEAYKEYMGGLAARGTLLHKVTENFFLKNNEPVPCELEYQGFVKSFYGFLTDYGSYIEPVAIELTLRSDAFKVAGTCDFICKFKEIPSYSNIKNVLSMIDYKTTKGNITPQMREKYCMQIACYIFMYNATSTEKIRQAVILPLKNTKTKSSYGELIILSEDEIKHYFELFLGYLIEFHMLYTNFNINIK